MEPPAGNSAQGRPAEPLPAQSWGVEETIASVRRGEASPVDDHLVEPSPHSVGDCYVDRPFCAIDQAEHHRRRRVRCECAVPACQTRSESDLFERPGSGAGCVHTAMHTSEAPRANTISEGVTRHPAPDGLFVGDQAELALEDLSDGFVRTDGSPFRSRGRTR